MLSFKSGIPIAHIIKAQKYNNSRRIKPEPEDPDLKDQGGGVNVKKKKKKRKKRKKKIKILKTIYVNLDVEDDDVPEMKTKKPSEIIDKNDLKTIKDKFKLNKYQMNSIKDNLSKMYDKKKENSFPQHLNSAFNDLKTIINDKLKKELRFYKDVQLIPCIDMAKNGFDGHTFVTGSTGSGKSSLINLLLQTDRKKRPIVFMSRLVKKDPSLKDMYDTKRVEKIELDDVDNFPDTETLGGKIVVFDDIENAGLSDDIMSMRDYLLECGRHIKDEKGESCSVICVSHAVSNYSKTKTPQRESKFCVLFPGSNKFESQNYLKYKMGLNKKDQEKFIKLALKEGRYLICHASYPPCIITQRSVFLL